MAVCGTANGYAALLPEQLPQHNKKTNHKGWSFCYGGGSWIRTSEVSDNRFTVCPLWPLGNSPIYCWSWWTESNHQPADYKSAALPLSHTSVLNVIYYSRNFFKCQYFFWKKSKFFRNIFLRLILAGFTLFIWRKIPKNRLFLDWSLKLTLSSDWLELFFML